jgi:hypothetical protein
MVQGGGSIGVTDRVIDGAAYGATDRGFDGAGWSIGVTDTVE